MFSIFMLATTLTALILGFNSGGAVPEQQPAKPVSSKVQTRPSRCRSLGRFRSTVYGPPWGGIEGGPITAMGVKLRPGRHIIAVDPRRIRLGSLVRVWPNPLRYRGDFLAADTGGAIRGNRVDIFVWQGNRFKDRWGVHSVRMCISGYKR